MTEDESPLAAGRFSAWLGEMHLALRGERDAEVPCGGCTACCTSSQFVHIGPDEAATLARIPAELLFPAPRLPVGNVLLGYDEQGRCPMLHDGGCSIYEDRPRTCRTYDCRVFAAAGIEADDDKPLIAQRARRWRFAIVDEADEVLRDAVLAASRYVRDHEAPISASHQAVRAVERVTPAPPEPRVPRARDAL